MPEVFFISDLHMDHTNILKFTKKDGSPLRNFKSIGDMHVIGLCNGHKRLVKGNHDGFKINSYLKVFEDIFGVRQIDGYWMTHVPMHEGSVNEPRVKMNLHGHYHDHLVLNQDGTPHEKYLNVTVEHINYTPIPFDKVKEKFNEHARKASNS